MNVIRSALQNDSMHASLVEFRRRLPQIVLVILACVAGCDSTSRGGQQVLQEITRDLGRIRPATRHIATFEVMNSSGVDWHLCSIQRECSCTEVLNPPSLIPTRETARFDLAFSSSADAGDVDKKVLLEFQEAEASIVRLVVKAAVRHELQLYPNQLELSAYENSNAAVLKRRINVSTIFDDTLDIQVAATSVDPWLSAKVEKLSSPEIREHNFRFCIGLDIQTAGLPAGFYRSRLNISARPSHDRDSDRLVLGSETKVKTTLPVLLHIKPVFSVVPSNFFFGRRASDSMATVSEVVITHLSAADLQQLKDCSVDIVEPHSPVRLLAIDRLSDSQWRIRCSIDWDKVSGPVDTLVRCEFGDKLSPLMIPAVAAPHIH